MAISYPLSVPASLRVRQLNLRLRRATAATQSPFSGVTQVVAWPFAQWMVDLELSTVTRTGGAPIEAFIAALRGRYGTFLWGPVHAKLPTGTANTVGVTVNGGGQTGNALAVAGLGAGKTLLSGDYFQLGSGSTARLYIVSQDATADGSGNATLSIEPALRTSPSNGDAVVLSSPLGQWRLTSDDVGVVVGAPGLYAVSLSCMEAL